jgi:sugar phosphate isomerase/epimerase
MSQSSRRAFLQQSCTFLAGAGLVGAGAQSASAIGRRRRVVQTSASTPAKPRLAAGCRDVMLKNSGATDCWKAFQAAGAQTMELTVADDLSLGSLVHPTKKYTMATQAGIDQLAADAKAAGCRISAFCLSNQFDVRPDFEVQWIGKAARAAKALGVKAIRIDVLPRKAIGPDYLEASVKVLKRTLAGIESTGVSLGVENHGRITNDPDFLQKLFDGVGSPRLGLTLDTGNFYWFGHPISKVYALFERFAPRVIHTHAKSIRYPADQRDTQRKMGFEYAKYNCPVYEGDIDFRRVAEILKKAGYQNDLCIEDESLGKFPEAERAKVLAREIAWLKSVG